MWASTAVKTLAHVSGKVLQNAVMDRHHDDYRLRILYGCWHSTRRDFSDRCSPRRKDKVHQRRSVPRQAGPDVGVDDERRRWKVRNSSMDLALD